MIILLALSGAVLAVSMGMADVYAQRGYDIMDSWSAKNPMTQDSWNDAYAEIERAQRLAPFHPVYHQRLARLERLSLSQWLVIAAERRQAADRGIAHLHASLEIRPYWPTAWIELAYLKWIRGEMDDEFYLALSNAARYGPWEPYVIRVLVAFGYERYSLVMAEPANADVIIGAYVKGLRSPVRSAQAFTFRILKLNERIQPRVIEAFLPHLKTQWPRGKSDDYFNIVNWLWARVEPADQTAMLKPMFIAIDRFRSAAYWLTNTEPEGLKAALCDHFAVSKPEDDLSAWCEAQPE